MAQEGLTMMATAIMTMMIATVQLTVHHSRNNCACLIYRKGGFTKLNRKIKE